MSCPALGPVAWPVFADEHGDLTVLPDAAALRRIEAVDVDADEYVFWDAVGRRLVPRVQDGAVSVGVPEDTGPRPAELVRVLVAHLLAVPGADPPQLDRAETAAEYLARCVRAVADAERRFPRRGWWHRPAPAGDPPPPPHTAPESWPGWWGEAGLVTPDRLDQVVATALADVPPGAVDVLRRHGVLELRPRAAGAAAVLVEYGAWGLYVTVHPDLPPLELTAPVTAGYGAPDRPWSDDLADVLAAASGGRLEVGSTPDGQPVSVDVVGTRLGARLGRHRGEELRRTAPWR